MKKSESTKFAKLMVAIGTLNGKDLPPEVVELYWRSLKCFAWADVHRALQAHIDNPDGGQFMPKPANIRRLLIGSGASRAADAWAKVEQAIEQIGSYTSVVFDDALIHAAIAHMGGWVKLCQTSTDHLAFRQIEFKRLYQDFLLTHANVYPKVLSGRVEALNTRDSYPVPPPTLVGDKERAKAVTCAGGGSALTIHEPAPVRGNFISTRSISQQECPT